MEEFKDRRARFGKLLSNNSIALLCSGELQMRNGDVDYAFRSNSDFYYLTGFPEPAATMVLTKDAHGKLSYILFNQPNDPNAEIWNGKRSGQQGACEQYLADAAYDVAQIDSVMPDLMADKKTIYYPLGQNETLDQQVITWLKSAKQKLQAGDKSNNTNLSFVPDTLTDLLPLIHEMRLFKSAQEVEYMRKAADISASAHLKLMQSCRPEQMEYQLEAIFNEHCLQNGCRGLAYNSIVAGGNNACTLHYTTNNQPLRAGDLVLVDAGGEYNCYASDITRTFPVSGKFSAEQAQIYELVLRAQLAGIAQVKPGNLWDSVQSAMLEVMVRGLVELQLLDGDVGQLIKDQAFRKFYMHGSGHWLGMDVHDVGKYKQNGAWRPFEPGMVLTVEPGIYIAKGTSGVADKWYGIGVRIEDDILVTKQGNEVLSARAPKQIDEIERAIL